MNSGDSAHSKRIMAASPVVANHSLQNSNTLRIYNGQFGCLIWHPPGRIGRRNIIAVSPDVR
jgi:hypothetical protein